MLPKIASPVKAGKDKTVAERVTWMSRTSDIFGSHVKSDMESYLSLIRRKIQEKCTTTQDLINQIRRNKIGDSPHVTPNEFRYTLIKFGVILAQPLVDKIFMVFDSDRSGTMDFDEFAMWIMNSEFKPVRVNDNTVKAAKQAQIDIIETLRKKICICISENSDLFSLMKRKVSWLEFISDITRKNMNVSEVEARQIFRQFDPSDSGYMDSQKLIQWAKTGNTITPRGYTPRPRKELTINEAIYKIAGKNIKALELSFSHIPRGKGVKLSYEEFRRALLENGLGQIQLECKDLFDSLGGGSKGCADIDLLLSKLGPIQEDPSSKVSAKKTASPSVCVSRVDRRLRDEMRKSFIDVKSEILNNDRNGTGYIESEKLFKIVMSYCTSLSFQDFRRIIQQLNTEENGSKVNWKQFLNAYNPRNAPHALQTTSSMVLDDDISISTIARGGGRGSSSSSSSSSSLMISKSKAATPLHEYHDDLSTSYGVDASKKSRGFLTAELRSVWHYILKDCHKADSDKSGLVSKAVFMGAIERANMNNALKPDMIRKLFDNYTLSNGLVDYTACFREVVLGVNYANPLSSVSSSDRLSSSVAQKKQSMKDERAIHALHPWEFNYKKGSDAPYWSQASIGKDMSALSSSNTLSTLIVPTAQQKGAQYLSSNEKTALLAQYSPHVLGICKSCLDLFYPVWRQLRSDFKRSQINSQRGNIITEKFLAVLEHNRVNIKKNDLSVIIKTFRGVGVQDVVRFDEFMRICLLLKDT